MPPISLLPWVHSPHGGPSHKYHRSTEGPQIRVSPTPGVHAPCCLRLCLDILQAAQTCGAHCIPLRSPSPNPQPALPNPCPNPCPDPSTPRSARALLPEPGGTLDSFSLSSAAHHAESNFSCAGLLHSLLTSSCPHPLSARGVLSKAKSNPPPIAKAPASLGSNPTCSR